MKIINRYLKLPVLLLMCFLPACDLQEANVNPNESTDASIAVILPVAQANLVWAIGDYTAQTTSVLLQQITGVLLEWRSTTDYDYLPRFFNESWNEKFYAGAMKDFNTIIEKSSENGATHYRGVAKIQMAMSLGYVVDLWGDAPYTTAFNLEGSPKPEFESGGGNLQPDPRPARRRDCRLADHECALPEP